MKLNNILFYSLVAVAIMLVIFMTLGIINENTKQTGAAIIFFGVCMVFIAVLKKK